MFSRRNSAIKQSQPFIFILDGYDEIRQNKNLYITNNLKDWQAKVIITCRSQYLLTLDYHAPYFMPYEGERPQGELFSEVVVKPFNQHQIDTYLQQYVKHHTTEWQDWEQYQQALQELPGLKELIQTPFLLRLAVETMPQIALLYEKAGNQSHRQQLTQAKLYDVFVKQWFTRQEEKLKASGQLKENETIKPNLWAYAQNLAKAMHQAQVTQISYVGPSDLLFVENEATNSWGKFFSEDPEIQLIRNASILKKVGENQYAFFHASLIDYFLSTEIHHKKQVVNCIDEPILDIKINQINKSKESRNQSQQQIKIKQNSTYDQQILQEIENYYTSETLPAHYYYFNQHLLTKEYGMLQFFADRAQGDEAFKQDLFRIIKGSKYDVNISISAANAITVLNKANVNFVLQNFEGINIPQADLSYSNCDHANFKGADLTGVNFTQAWLRGANFNHAIMKDINFGQEVDFQQLTELQIGGTSRVIAYNSTINCVAIAADKNINICNLNRGAQFTSLQGHKTNIYAIIFSSDGKKLVSVCTDSMRVWDVATGTFKILAERQDLPKETKLQLFTFSPDGKYLAYKRAYWKEIHIYAIDTGQFKLIKGHIKEINSLAFSEDSLKIISSGKDHTCRIWNVSEDKEIFNLSGQASVVQFVAPRLEDTQIVYVTNSYIKVRNIHTHEVQAQINYSETTFENTVMSPNKNLIAMSSQNNSIWLCDLITKELYKIGEEASFIRILVFSPDSKYLAAGGDSKVASVWDLTKRQVQIYKKHKGIIKVVGFSQDSCELISICSDNIIHVTKIFQGISITPQSGTLSAINTAAFSPNGEVIATVSKDKKIKIWKLISNEFKSISIDIDKINSLVFSPNGNKLICMVNKLNKSLKFVRNLRYSGSDKKLQKNNHKYSVLIYDLVSGNKWEINESNSNNNLVAISIDSHWSAIGNDEKLQILDLKHNQIVSTKLYQKKEKIRAIVFSQYTGSFLVLTNNSRNYTIPVNEIIGGKRVEKKNFYREECDMVMSSDGKLLLINPKFEDNNIYEWKPKHELVVDNDKNSIVYNDATMERVFSLPKIDSAKRGFYNLLTKKFHSIEENFEQCSYAKFSSKNQWLAAVLGDDILKVWQVIHGKVKTFEGHKGRIYSLDFSPDEKFIVSGSKDKTVRIWSLENEQYTILTGFLDTVTSVNFHPDIHQNYLLVTTCKDGSLKCWQYYPELENQQSTWCLVWVNQSINLELSKASFDSVSLLPDKYCNFLEKQQMDTMIYRKYKKYQEEIATYTKALEWSITESNHGTNRISVHNKFNRFKVAFRDYQENHVPNYYYNRGLAYHKLGRYELAFKDYQQAHMLDPNDLDVLNNLGVINERLGNYEEAIKYYEELIKILEIETTDDGMISYYRDKYNSPGVFDAHEINYQMNYNLRYRLSNGSLYLLSNIILLKTKVLGVSQVNLLNQYKDIIKKFDNKFDNKNDVFLLGRYAVILAYDNKIELAKQQIDMMKVEYKEECWANYFKGWVRYLLKDYNRAIQYFNEVCDIETFENHYYCLSASLALRGQCYYELSIIDKAVTDLEEALKRIPQHREWKLIYQAVIAKKQQIQYDNKHIDEILALGEYKSISPDEYLSENQVKNFKSISTDNTIDKTQSINSASSIAPAVSNTNIKYNDLDLRLDVNNSHNTNQFWENLNIKNQYNKINNLSEDKNNNYHKVETIYLSEEIIYLSLNDSIKKAASSYNDKIRIDISKQSKNVNSSEKLEHQISSAIDKVLIENTQTSNLQQRLQFWREKESLAQAQQKSLVRSNTNPIQPFETKPITFNK